MIIALFPNITKNQSINLAFGIREFFTLRGIEVVAPDEIAESFGAKPLSSISEEEITYQISMGGDGTILRLLHKYPNIEAPLLGINLGALGFLADVRISELYPSLQDLIDGHFQIEERIMMEGKTSQNDSSFALNEIVVHRSKTPSLVDLSIHVDGVYLNTFSADGIILATPSGSTAYNLAAGGPILTPELKAFVLSPVCPHTISNRPIVFFPKKEIQIQYLSEHDPVEISCDGTTHWSLNTGEVFYITPSSRSFKLINLHRHNYYETLRSKLGWTGKIRN